MENFFGMFNYFGAKAEFDFVANILANVSSLKEGRQLLIEKEIFKQVILTVKENKAALGSHRRKHLLESIRNCCFEYEKYQQDFVQIDLLDSLIIMLINEQGIAALPEELQAKFGKHAPKKELFMSKVDMKNS